MHTPHTPISRPMSTQSTLERVAVSADIRIAQLSGVNCETKRFGYAF
jgi:hypothetical protein